MRHRLFAIASYYARCFVHLRSRGRRRARVRTLEARATSIDDRASIDARSIDVARPRSIDRTWTKQRA
jgi:hypothetical protein